MTNSTIRKVAAKKARNTKRKSPSKVTSNKAHDSHRKTTAKVAAKQLYRKSASKFAEKVRDTQRKTAAQFEELVRHEQVEDSVVNKSRAETRALYESPKEAFQAVLKSWEKSFGAAGKGVVAVNRAIIDIAQRNIKTSFEFATSLAGTKSLADVVQLQAAYWRKHLG